MIYVDKLCRRSVDGEKKEWLAMATSDDPEAIQHLAEVLKIDPRYKLEGLRRPCYYLTPTQRSKAIEMGAKEACTVDLMDILLTKKVSE